MKWFKQWRAETKNKALLEMSFAKLEFLSTEFLNDRDRKVDVVHWLKELNDAELYCDGSVITRYAIQAYYLIFKLYKRKHGLTLDLEGVEQVIEEIVIS
ncbi:hypothetical protein JOD82_002313 [Paenibacillus sp. 1182]|uniref:hypothetical protein n=1 Tax=Paenibacillus sp. 1182 TaxID=2806565 RepID=UPI001B56A18A|nr:hypothetical protein [Paenibacillus sp. 1182]MBP1309293.1 hypothetical protein [Paenibacillus sp. 1182]